MNWSLRPQPAAHPGWQPTLRSKAPAVAKERAAGAVGIGDPPEIERALPLGRTGRAARG